ncbi:CaiB/BaiF CoA-transferase family protein [Ramlibacter sp. WS9]|uniref:CaiB/BaiF CoA transferase family protein n=1 Tax=Ramlibacter sp. WS9 TaxID=1882741 RepID=UPI0011423E1B|nr:CoA transferase [Ramlibacter sp. WS9]ROZ78070.1 CoA transferase [Ramlibacter sp. WS9]
MSGPLAGIRIIDMTTMLSGPWAAMILADQGADVIKVEVPEAGDHVRSLGNQRAGMSAMFLNINRNKRSVSVDVKNPQGRQIVLDLAKGADVFMQNFRPGVVDRLGVGEADIRAVAPNIIYASISGFGDVGPWVGKPVYDPVIQAISGLTTVQAGSDGERPRLIRTVLPDKLAAVTVAQSLSAALVSRHRTGEGQHVRISMLDSVLYFLWASDMGAQTYPDKTMSNQEAASFIDLIYETKDGHMTVAVMSNKEWVGLTKALDKPEWLADARFATPKARDSHVNERLLMTQEVLKTRTTGEWMECLEAHDVPCAPALTRSEVIRHPQVLASETIVEVDHPAAGRLRQARSPARFERTPSELRRGAPLLGQHNDEILAELGYSESMRNELRSARIIGSESLRNKT